MDVAKPVMSFFYFTDSSIAPQFGQSSFSFSKFNLSLNKRLKVNN